MPDVAYLAAVTKLNALRDPSRIQHLVILCLASAGARCCYPTLAMRHTCIDSASRRHDAQTHSMCRSTSRTFCNKLPDVNILCQLAAHQPKVSVAEDIVHRE